MNCIDGFTYRQKINHPFQRCLHPKVVKALISVDSSSTLNLNKIKFKTYKIRHKLRHYLQPQSTDSKNESTGSPLFLIFTHFQEWKLKEPLITN
jgi:hypothetical protein